MRKLALTGLVLFFAAPTAAQAEVTQLDMPARVVASTNGQFVDTYTFDVAHPVANLMLSRDLRTVLTTAFEGYSITHIAIPGVGADAIDLDNVTETLPVLMGRMKNVRLKKVIDGDDKIFVSVRGKRTFTAGDIGRHTNAYEIVNPEYVIAHLDAGAQFDIAFDVGKGVGYEAAAAHTDPDDASGRLAVNANFNPIKRAVVSFLKTPDVGEQVVLEITTDKTLTASQALLEALAALNRIFSAEPEYVAAP